MADFLPNYQGNAGLGTGTGGNVLPDENSFASAQKAFDNSFAVNIQGQQDRLKMLGDTQKTIALLDQEFNTKMWQQKIADRDNMYQEFLKGNASVKDYLPEDSGAIAAAREKYDNAYKDWTKNINNSDAAKAFKQAADEQNDVAARAATRYAGKNEQDKIAAATLLPDEKNARLKNIDGWLKAKDADGKMALPIIYQPYQKYDGPAFKGQTVTKTFNIPSKDKLYNTPFTVFDYKGTREKVSDSTKELGKANVANEFQHKYFDVIPTAEKQKNKLDEINKAIDEHNTKHPEDQAPKLSAEFIGGKWHLTSDAEDYAAAYLLAQNPDKRGDAEPSEFALKAKAEKDKTDIGWYNAETARMKDNILLDKWNFQKGSLTKDEQVANQKYTDLTNSIIPTAANNLTGKQGYGSIDLGGQPQANQFISGIVYDNKGKQTIGRVMPKFTIIDKDGKDVSGASDYSLKTYNADANVNKGDYNQWLQLKAKDEGSSVNARYDVKYFMPNGTQINNNNVWEVLPPEARAEYKSLFRTMKKPPTLPQYLKIIAAKGNILTHFEGQNGVGTPISILEGSRYEQSKYGKKGFEGVYAPDGDDAGTETTTTESGETQTP